MGAVFTGPEWAAGLTQDAKTKDRRLIPVRVRPVNVSGLLGAFVYIDLVGKDEPAAREALLSGITSGRAKPHQVAFPGAGSSQSPAFPGASSPPGARDSPEGYYQVLVEEKPRTRYTLARGHPVRRTSTHPSPCLVVGWRRGLTRSSRWCFARPASVWRISASWYLRKSSLRPPSRRRPKATKPYKIIML